MCINVALVLNDYYGMTERKHTEGINGEKAGTFWQKHLSC